MEYAQTVEVDDMLSARYDCPACGGTQTLVVTRDDDGNYTSVCSICEKRLERAGQMRQAGESKYVTLFGVGTKIDDTQKYVLRKMNKLNLQIYESRHDYPLSALKALLEEPPKDMFKTRLSAKKAVEEDAKVCIELGMDSPDRTADISQYIETVEEELNKAKELVNAYCE